VRRGVLLGLTSLGIAIAAGCGGGEDTGTGDLVWDARPRVFTNPRLPDDRVLTGVVRNDTLEPVDLVAKDLVVRASDGDELESAAIFAPTFIRSVFPQNRGSEIPIPEQIRIGLRTRLQPGQTVPVTVSWHQRGEHASLIAYGTGSLPVP
jgi:hypothetical protein